MFKYVWRIYANEYLVMYSLYQFDTIEDATKDMLGHFTEYKSGKMYNKSDKHKFEVVDWQP